jgi:quinoprotein glucose dehydrogenase
VKEFATFRSGGQFLPIGLNQETVVFPCFLGGAEWGGPAVDPTRGVIYVNANEAACVLGLTRLPVPESESTIINAVFVTARI